MFLVIIILSGYKCNKNKNKTKKKYIKKKNKTLKIYNLNFTHIKKTKNICHN